MLCLSCSIYPAPSHSHQFINGYHGSTINFLKIFQSHTCHPTRHPETAVSLFLQSTLCTQLSGRASTLPTPFWRAKRSAVQTQLFHPLIVFALTALCSFFSGTFLHANSQRCSRRLCIYLFDIHNLTFHLERGGVIVSTMYISHVRTHVAHNHKFFIPVFCF